MDFTLKIYRELLLALKHAGYQFVTMEQLVDAQSSTGKYCCMRHDVDLRAENSLRTALIEHALGIRATYYFRVVPQSCQPYIIRQIVALGHEVGYHYEDMSICHGNQDTAYQHFQDKLAYFRTFYPVRTICMHGAPTSRYDGRDLWKTHDYKALGITCEPYLDLNYQQLLYLTDTGRCWDGYKVSVRDKIPEHQDRWIREGLGYHGTADIINALQDEHSPLRQSAYSLLITTHPQRWTDNLLPWLREREVQQLKNIIKRVIVRHK